MAAELLDFEQPIGVLLKEIDALSMMPQTEARAADIARLRGRIDALRAELFGALTPWQVVQVSRHAGRPGTLDYIERLFTDFVEVHGDRRFADDPAIVCGMAAYHGDPVLVVGHQKGTDDQGEDRAQFRLRAAGRLPQGAPGDADGREVRAGRSSSSSTRPRRSRGSNRRSGASPRPSR